MDQIEIETTAIETNVRTLIKTHPSPKQFIETLRNEAIDQAFREISESIETLAERIQDECASKSEMNTLKKHVEFLEKRTHHLIPKLEE